MMMARRPIAGAANGARLVAHMAAGTVLAAACGWGRIEAIGAPVDADASQDATHEGPEESDEAAGPDDGASPEAEGPDATTADVAAQPEASADGAGAPLACSAVATPTQEWTFDSDVQGWTLATDTGVIGTRSWTGSLGNPSSGALEVAVTSSASDAAADGAWAEYDATPLGNLSGRTVSAWVWLDSGPSPHLKLFVQTGSQYTWADNGTIDLAQRVWTCVSMPVSSPSYTNGPNYDPTNVVRLGFEMLASSPFRIYIDTVRY